jgi:hypothetical protein
MTLRQNIQRALTASECGNYPALIVRETQAQKDMRAAQPNSLRWFAARLNVHYAHLSLVLSGKRSSPKLMSRYNQLKGTR